MSNNSTEVGQRQQCREDSHAGESAVEVWTFGTTTQVNKQEVQTKLSSNEALEDFKAMPIMSRLCLTSRPS